MVALHCKELFEQLRLRTKKPKKKLDDDYGRLFGYAPPTIRAWRDGKAKPQTLDVIEKLALDGMIEAKMSFEWLSNFLSAVDASALYDTIVSKLPVESSQPVSSKRFPIRAAWGMLVHPMGNLTATLSELEIKTNRPTVLFLGGASDMSEVELKRVAIWIASAFAPLWKNYPVSIIDGATDAGIVHLLGQVYRTSGARPPLIGVVTHSTVKWPGKTRSRPADEDLEPNHTQFLLTPGNKWEDAAIWLARIGRAIAGDKPALAVLVNGGLVAWKEVMCCLQAGIPVVTVQGSGRTADDLAEAAQLGGDTSLILTGAVHVVHLNKPEELRLVFDQRLGPHACPIPHASP